jgi:oligosaccharide repeat unit polymerase
LWILIDDPIGSVYRDEAFGHGESILFGKGYAIYLYQFTVIPVIFMSFIGGLVFYVVYKQRTLLWFSSCLLVMDAVMMLGRFHFYIMFVLLCASLIFHKQQIQTTGRMDHDTSRGRWGSFSIAVVMILLALFVSSLRNTESLQDEGTTLLGRTIVNYHTGGIVMFDAELQDPTSLLRSKMTYGRGVLGALDTFMVLSIRPKNVQTVAGEVGYYLNDFRPLGRDMGTPIFMNAFATVLYTLYFDGREVAVFVFPWLYGYGLTRLYGRWIKGRDIHSFMLVLLLLYVGVFSIFQSYVSDFRFWPVLLGIVALNKLTLRIHRPVDHVAHTSTHSPLTPPIMSPENWTRV